MGELIIQNSSFELFSKTKENNKSKNIEMSKPKKCGYTLVKRAISFIDSFRKTLHHFSPALISFLIIMIVGLLMSAVTEANPGIINMFSTSSDTPWGVLTSIFLNITVEYLAVNLLGIFAFIFCFIISSSMLSTPEKRKRSYFLSCAVFVSAITANVIMIVVNPQVSSTGTSTLVYSYEGVVLIFAMYNILNIKLAKSNLIQLILWISNPLIIFWVLFDVGSQLLNAPSLFWNSQINVLNHYYAFSIGLFATFVYLWIHPRFNQQVTKTANFVLVTLGNWGKEYRGDFVAGTIAFLVPFLITLSINGTSDVVTWTSLGGFVALILVISLGHPKVFSSSLNRWRRCKFRYPIRIGILNGYINKEKKGILPNRPFTEYEPEDWHQYLSYNENFLVSLISASEISPKFDIIVNPFGEEYPEIDKPNRRTLNNISKFVRDGGIFVNVAGLAFYYLWDGEVEDLSGPLLETYRLERSGLLNRIVLLRASHLLDCALYEYFGIRTTFFSPHVISVYGVTDPFFEDLDRIGNGPANICSFRSPYRSEKEDVTLKPLLKAQYTDKDPTQNDKIFRFECYPIAAVEVGRGYLILNGVKLQKTRPQDFLKEIETIVFVSKKLNKEGYI